jgi:hypothetical protein
MTTPVFIECIGTLIGIDFTMQLFGALPRTALQSHSVHSIQPIVADTTLPISGRSPRVLRLASL